MNWEETVGWSTAFVVASVAIVVSTSLTIFVFTRRQFKRKQSYYLPVNLALTDLIVGTIALPLFVCLLNFSQNFTLNIIYQVFDITAGLTSVSSIALISLERLYAIGWPLQHRLLERRHYIIGITSTWLYGIVVMVLLRFIVARGAVEGAHLTVCAIGAPLLITVVAYVALYIIKKKSLGNLQQRTASSRNNKLAQTLLIVTVIFFLTWTPFCIMNAVIIYSCKYGKCLYGSSNMVTVTKLLHYSNSFANSAIYALRIPPFRAALRNILSPRRGEWDRRATRVDFQTSRSMEIQELGIRNLGLEHTDLQDLESGQ